MSGDKRDQSAIPLDFLKTSNVPDHVIMLMTNLYNLVTEPNAYHHFIAPLFVPQCTRHQKRLDFSNDHDVTVAESRRL